MEWLHVWVITLNKQLTLVISDDEEHRNGYEVGDAQDNDEDSKYDGRIVLLFSSEVVGLTEREEHEVEIHEVDHIVQVTPLHSA